MTEEKKKERLIINIINGIPCIFLPPGILGKKLPPPKIIPFGFGRMQDRRSKDTMPDVMDELKKLFHKGDFTVSYFKLPEQKKDNKEDKSDNEKRRRET